MNNDFMTGFEKTAGITTMGKIVKVVRRVGKKISPTKFPRATPHPATVNIARKMRGKEQVLDGMRKRIGDKRMKEIVQMKKAKDIANYKTKVKTIAPKSGQYQGTTHDYAKYRAEFKEKALRDRKRKF